MIHEASCMEDELKLRDKFFAFLKEKTDDIAYYHAPFDQEYTLDQFRAMKDGVEENGFNLYEEEDGEEPGTTTDEGLVIPPPPPSHKVIIHQEEEEKPAAARVPEYFTSL
jgi:hypothetical protein